MAISVTISLAGGKALLNNSDEKQEVNVSRFKENIQHYTTGKDVITRQTINLKNNISIEAKSALILELK